MAQAFRLNDKGAQLGVGRWHVRTPASALAVALIAVVTACSPVFNWREVGLGDSGLTALLPCKPDRATRDVGLGGDQVALQMAGCEAGGATFTMAYAVASDATQATAWMAAWKTGMTRRLQAPTPVETVINVRGAAAVPASLQWIADGRDATGQPVPARVWWFTQAAKSGESAQVLLYQATVLGQPVEAEAATTFFESLHLP